MGFLCPRSDAAEGAHHQIQVLDYVWLWCVSSSSFPSACHKHIFSIDPNFFGVASSADSTAGGPCCLREAAAAPELQPFLAVKRIAWMGVEILVLAGQNMTLLGGFFTLELHVSRNEASVNPCTVCHSIISSFKDTLLISWLHHVFIWDLRLRKLDRNHTWFLFTTNTSSDNCLGRFYSSNFCFCFLLGFLKNSTGELFLSSLPSCVHWISLVNFMLVSSSAESLQPAARQSEASSSVSKMRRVSFWISGSSLKYSKSSLELRLRYGGELTWPWRGKCAAEWLGLASSSKFAHADP